MTEQRWRPAARPGRQTVSGGGVIDVSVKPPPPVLGRPRPLLARSHGNGADSEQLVFVVFGSGGAAGPLPGAGGVRWAEPLPDTQTSAGTDASVLLGSAS